MNNTIVPNRVAFSIILLVTAVLSYVIYLSALAYYADLTAMYNSQGEAAWAQRTLLIQSRNSKNIGTGLFIRGE